MNLLSGVVLAAVLLTWNTVGALANPAQPENLRTDHAVETLALQWFAEMRAGRIDRTQLTAKYSAQLTDDAVRGMSRYLGEYQYGASPTGAKILQTHSTGDQNFYVVKLIFPRGDAASFLFGFNAAGKITGITLLSMAGD